MLFTQIEFYFLLAAVFAAVWAIRNFNAQKLVLLASSYYFYAYWDWRFAGLLLSCTAVNYWLAGLMVRSANPKVRKALVTASLVYSLGVLGFFKYFHFFLDSFQSVSGIDPGALGNLRIILPIGISFFTFQTLSYTIDVYRGSLPHCRRFTDFALYVAFFPQLVAGPIVRASEFLPQLETPRRLTWQRTYEGFEQFVFGLFKKVFIADHLAQFVDPAFENAAALSGLTLWIAVLAYAVQIYCDFSGYSDMAIGISRALGYDLSRNFNHPYLATSIQDFWRRWHISLSSWLRDYLYIPLGGNRLGPLRTYLNLFLTMLLGGLWHGANWTFVFWGAWHGLGLCLDRLIQSRRSTTGPPHPLAKVLGWLITLGVVLVGWTLFRAPDLRTAFEILGKMTTFAGGVAWYPPLTLSLLAAVAVYHAFLSLTSRDELRLSPQQLSTPALLFSFLWLVIAFFPQGFQPFIYFQF